MGTRDISVDKQEAVGGKGGGEFDSGCNLSGICKVHIHHGNFFFGNKFAYYNCVIKRIFLEFNKPTQSNKKQKGEPWYGQHGTNGHTTENTILLNSNDRIVKIDVWTDGFIVNAIRFVMKSGTISQIYGRPAGSYKSFEGKNEKSQLVGIHGRYGGIIDSLGFTFASTEVIDDGDDGNNSPYLDNNAGNVIVDDNDDDDDNSDFLPTSNCTSHQFNDNEYELNMS